MKYEFTQKTIAVNGIVLKQIRAVRPIQTTCEWFDVEVGDTGGWIEDESNLSHDGNAWVYETAKVSGNAIVFGNARVYKNAWIYNDAKVFDAAHVYGNAHISGNVSVFGDAQIYGNAQIFGDAQIYENAWVSGNTVVCDNAQVKGSVWIKGDSRIDGKAVLSGITNIDNVRVSTNAAISCQSDILWVPNVTSEKVTLAAFNTTEGDIGVTFGYFSGSLDKFTEFINTNYKNHELKTRLVVDFIKNHFNC